MVHTEKGTMQSLYLRNECYRQNSTKNKLRNLTVAVMGLKRVGKSSIIHHLEMTYKAKHSHDKDTEGHRVKINNLVLNFVECHCKDTTDISDIISANVFILVFAVDDLESYEYVESLKDLILDTKGTRPAVVVVGNKHDASQREVGFVYTDCVVSLDWEMPYVEASVRTGYNLRHILPYLFRDVSLKPFRHLFVEEPVHDSQSRRKSTGSEKTTLQVEGQDEEQRKRASSLSLSGTWRKLVGRDKSLQSKNPPANKTSEPETPRRRSLTSVIPCIVVEEQSTPETTRTMSSCFLEVTEKSPTFYRKRSNSTCATVWESETPTLLPISRRRSVAVPRACFRKDDFVMLTKSGKRSERLLATIRKHLKK